MFGISIRVVCAASIVLTICAVYVIFSRQSAPNQLNFMATVEPNTEFWLHRTRYEGLKGYWEKESPFPRDQAMIILQAMSTAEPWEPGKYRFFGSREYHPLPPMLVLGWCKNIRDAAQREKGTVCILSGNEFFDYGASTYRLSQEGRKILDSMFPDNSRNRGRDDAKRQNDKGDVDKGR